MSLQNPTLVQRVLIAAICSLAVAATAYIAAWYQFRGILPHRLSQTMTHFGLNALQSEIDKYRREKGVLPVILRDLGTIEDKSVVTNEKGEPLDYWGHAFEYHLQ